MMKTVSIRELQLHTNVYFKELPIAVTKYNKIVAVITTPQQFQEWTKKKIEIDEK